MSVKAIPAGHRTVTPYLAIKNAAKALEFYKTAFGATETYKLMMPDGRLGHAEISIGDSVIMMSDEFPEYGGNAPETLGGSPVSIHLYVEDVDAFFKKALAAGAKERKPVTDQFYGDRTGQLEDPFGHLWWVATHKEDVAPEEIQKRAEGDVCSEEIKRAERTTAQRPVWSRFRRGNQDQQSKYLKHIFGFIGFTDIREIFIEPMEANPTSTVEALAAASHKAAEMAAHFFSRRLKHRKQTISSPQKFKTSDSISRILCRMSK
jgi:PhnB protein